MRLTMIVAALAPFIVSATAPAPLAQMPEWLTGCWIERQGDRWAEECWTAPRGGQMLGAGRVGRGDTLDNWELMRIERAPENALENAGQLALFAAPKGTGWTQFVAVPDAGRGVTFVNAANDYPQRIRYWRDGETLKAEIAMRDGGRAKRWTFTRSDGR